MLDKKIHLSDEVKMEKLGKGEVTCLLWYTIILMSGSSGDDQEDHKQQSLDIGTPSYYSADSQK